MAEFVMPSLGADMEAGTLVEWVKQPGDTVQRGDIIAVVETQKGAIEVEVFQDGTLEKILVQEGTEVPVGTPLAVIDGKGAGEAEAATAEAAAPAPVRPERPAVRPAPPREGRRASPAARRLAAEHAINLAEIETGSGPGGAVISDDVLRAARTEKPAAREKEKPADKRKRGLDLAEMRKAIAAAMAKSEPEIPHYYLAHEIELTRANDFLERTNAERAPTDRLLMAVLLLKATALALKKHTQFNGFFEDGEFRASEAIHLGTAVAIRGGGLIAPAIHGADAKSLDDLMTALRDLVARVRAGRLRNSEMTDATVTVSSLGERGVEALYGVIYPPQVALVEFGTPSRRPRVADDGLAARWCTTATLSADHRVSDGHRGALFLAEIDRLLQEPEAL